MVILFLFDVVHSNHRHLLPPAADTRGLTRCRTTCRTTCQRLSWVVSINTPEHNPAVRTAGSLDTCHMVCLYFTSHGATQEIRLDGMVVVASVLPPNNLYVTGLLPAIDKSPRSSIPLLTPARHTAFFGDNLAIYLHFVLCTSSLHSQLHQVNAKSATSRMRLSPIILAATALITASAVPLPLHDTNTQRLPDHPTFTHHPDYPATDIVQKHKYVPEIVEPILRLCGRSLGYQDTALLSLREMNSVS
ncbi:hypothetical protein BU25DRAFT_426286 [Macroventuria anomochaeta]|uniref:Uncharacterized protein n=1 Tax=Macroventuria anomochaeta TaxID=301207 RepID=A0ACB6RKR1_9PLEO|nr:uncharacterized protein BU25DRAFT_426286 [Macroventuria anomochaeta]KAF2621683.1 hypothetical protein BU25DRAFT_426286 [Macroventuria anomochaeta]